MPLVFPSQAVVSTEKVTFLSLHLPNQCQPYYYLTEYIRVSEIIYSHSKETCDRPATDWTVLHRLILQLTFPLIHLEQLAS